MLGRRTRAQLPGAAARSAICGLAVSLVAACGNLPSPAELTGINDLAGAFTPSVSLQVRPVIERGGFRTAALVEPFTIADISELTIKVAADLEPDTVVAQATVQTDAIGSLVSFSNLMPDTRYRIASTAMDASGSVISVDASSGVTVDVGLDDQLDPIVLGIRLKDKVFSASGVVDHVLVREGALVPVGTISVHVGEASASTAN